MNQENMCRAVTFPIVADGPDEWKPLDELFHKCWDMSTHLANWSMSQLYMTDVATLDRSGGKLAAMPRLNLYALAVRFYPRWQQWKGACQQASTVLHNVQKKYANERLDTVWRGRRSLASFRYPYPFPIHNQSWRPQYGPDNVPMVRLTLPGGSIEARLRGGIEMHRQLTRFEQLVNGAKRGEAALYRKGRHVMLKMVGHFPLGKTVKKRRERIMTVRTHHAALWEVEIEGTHTRLWNQDHMRALVDNHRIWRQRLSEDMKAEKRVPAKLKRHMLQKLEDRCRKMNDRLATFCHEMTKQLAQFAQRQKATKVIYSDKCKDWLNPFPWHQLKEKLAYKLEELGIDFTASKDDSASDDAA